MAKLEFGMRQGLAFDMQWDQRINDLRYQEQAKKQATISAKADAKMYADDMQYATPMNEFDSPKVKAHAQFQIKRLGQYANQNPDWETNVAKRGEYSQIVNELKNGADYKRGVQSDTAWAEAQKDMADPKNSDRDFTAVKEEWANYVRTGNQLGEGSAKTEGAKQFVYKTPEADTTIMKDLQDLASKTKQEGWKADNSGFSKGKQFTTDADKNAQVEMAIADSVYGKKIQKAYTAYLAQQVGNETTKAKTINQFTREIMEPSFPSPVFHAGQQWQQQIKPRGGDNGKTEAPIRNLFKEAKDAAKSNPNIPVQLDAKGASALLKDEDGVTDLTNIEILNPGSGNRKSVNFGTTKNVTTSQSKIVYVGAPGKERPYISGKVTMPVKQFTSSTGIEVNDPWWFSWWRDPKGTDATDAANVTGAENENEVKDKFRLIVNDAGEDAVEFEFYKPIDDEVNTNIPHAYNQGAGQKSEEFTSDNKQPATRLTKEQASKYPAEQVKQAIEQGLIIVE